MNGSHRNDWGNIVGDDGSERRLLSDESSRLDGGNAHVARL